MVQRSLLAPTLSDKSLQQSECGRAPRAGSTALWPAARDKHQSRSTAFQWVNLDMVLQHRGAKAKVQSRSFNSNHLIQHKTRDKAAGTGTPASALLYSALRMSPAPGWGELVEAAGDSVRMATFLKLQTSRAPCPCILSLMCWLNISLCCWPGRRGRRNLGTLVLESWLVSS